ncbi:hypothetical protein K438DRAFT_1829539 [Mycena galopus ATCC 62051]|nr:hypothetical protein K438DRAFT_1829539 [Mycena galopus ATCC 62051]
MGRIAPLHIEFRAASAARLNGSLTLNDALWGLVPLVISCARLSSPRGIRASCFRRRPSTSLEHVNKTPCAVLPVDYTAASLAALENIPTCLVPLEVPLLNRILHLALPLRTPERHSSRPQIWSPRVTGTPCGETPSRMADFSTAPLLRFYNFQDNIDRLAPCNDTQSSYTALNGRTSSISARSPRSYLRRSDHLQSFCKIVVLDVNTKPSSATASSALLCKRAPTFR